MSRGELLTKAFIWLALTTYAWSSVAAVFRKPESILRWIWTIGCLFYIAHVFCAFAYFHHWSHDDAYLETARQTRELTGWNWGGGIFVNYLFTAAWLTDVLWWWLAPASHSRRSSGVVALWQGFIFFMVFNGTVVFGHGPVRWFGAAICAIVLLCWWRSPRAARAAI